MKMNFGSVAEINTTASGNYLRPWNVYKNVKFNGISEPVTGTTKDGDTWRAWDFTFTSPQGDYKERVFEPKDENRGSYKNANGHEVELPSSFERILNMAAQLIDAYNPTKKDSFNDYCVKKVNAVEDPHKQFDLFIAGLKKVIEGTDNTADLLLAGRTTDGKVYASLPNFVRINSNTHEAYTSERFVGHDLCLSSYEKGEQDKYNSARPTNMDKTENKPNASKGSEDSIENFDDLL